jgi:hypothetical protein
MGGHTKTHKVHEAYKPSAQGERGVKIYVLMTKARDEKLKFEKAHFYLWE